LGRTELERSWRYKRPLSAIMMDVDHFKSINDSFGHSSGDCVLRAIANLCVESMRKLDIIGRYGGEEFVILLPETDNEQAHQAAERLREEISRLRVSTGHGEISVTASFGVHTFDSIFYQDTLPDDQLDKLIDLADQALLTAKQLGRNRVAF
jgi:diguanylate cyclase (GGDEF)-like protein